jgi:hypothetical protein
MGALNYVTLAISILALLFILIAEGTEDWLTYEFKRTAGCKTTVTVDLSLYKRVTSAEFKDNGDCGVPHQDDFTSFNTCTDDEAFEACTYSMVSRGSSGAAVALGVLLVLAQIFLVYFEAKSKPVATRALSIASYWLFVGVTVAALTCAGAFKKYHGIVIHLFRVSFL